MHPSFIRGFVKQCYDQGLSEDQAEAALRAFSLREQLEDPDFRAGFDKQAVGWQDLLTQGKELASRGVTAFQGLGRPAQGALVGGTAGLLFGGKRRLRNALIGGAFGGGAGYLMDKYNQPSSAGVANTPDMGASMSAAGIPTLDQTEGAAALRRQLAGGGNPFDPKSVSSGDAFNKTLPPLATGLSKTPTAPGAKLTPAGPTAGALHQFAMHADTDPELATSAFDKERALTRDDSGNVGAALVGAGQGLKNIAAAPGQVAKAVGKPLVKSIKATGGLIRAGHEKELERVRAQIRKNVAEYKLTGDDALLNENNRLILDARRRAADLAR